MSLLLDALKKAERAKQDAQRQAESESAASPPEGGLSIEQPAAEDAPSSS